MIGWFKKRLTHEEQSLDHFLDDLVSPSTLNPEPPKNQIGGFAGWFQGLPGDPFLPPADKDPVLANLLAEQKRFIHTDSSKPLAPRQRNRRGENERAPRDDDDYGQAALLSGDRAAGRPGILVPSYAMAAVVLGLVAVGIFAFAMNLTDDKDSGTRLGQIGLLDKNGDESEAGFASPVADPLPEVTIDGVTITIRDWNLLGIVRTAFADEKPARDLFLVLDVTLVNTLQGTNRDAPFKNLWVVDENGEAYAIDNYATVLANDAIGSFGSVSNIALDNGAEHDLMLLFDVPSDITTLYLTDAGRTFSIPIVGP